MEDKHTEKSILKAVHNYFSGDYRYCIKNTFLFKHDWESDYFCVNKEGYSFEIEAKISKRDYKNDFKKEKHKFFQLKETKQFRPNKFYYAVPEGLINETDLPPYAGLIIVSGNHAFISKRAPFIHKTKHDLRKVLCDKFYYNWLIQKRSNSIMENDLKIVKNRISKLWIDRFVFEGKQWQVNKIDFESKTVVGTLQPYYDLKLKEYVKTYEVRTFNIKEVEFQ